jgi:2-methylaconitate cis-trans-isomerase PrpF
VDVQVRPATPVHPADVVLATPGCPGLLALRVNNPYLLLNADAVGLSARELLGLAGPADPGLLHPFTAAVAQVQTQLGLPAGGDLPKLAVLAVEGRDTIVARTVYLGRWHPGLPLTGAITFLTAALVPQSPWYHRDVALHGLRLSTPAGDIRVSTSANRGVLTSFHIPAREVTCDVAASFV